jgi:hypothetical protein
MAPWQIEGLRGEGKPTADLEQATTAIQNELVRILGAA